MVNKTLVHKEEEVKVKEWVVDVSALMDSPEIVRERNVKIPYHVVKEYNAVEPDVGKKEVVLRAILKDEDKVVHGVGKNFLDLNSTEYGLITSDLGKIANTELTRPVVIPSELLKVGYSGVEFFDVEDEEILPYLTEGLFNGHSGQFVHDFKLEENQYVILGNNYTNSHKKFYIVQNGQLDEIDYNSSVIKGVSGEKVTPRNDRQRLAMDLLHRRDIPLKLISGIVGGGKSLAPFHS